MSWNYVTLIGNVSGGLLIGSGGGVSCINVSSLDVLSLTGNIVVSFWVVDNLGFNWEILDSFPSSFNRFVFNNGLFDFLRNVFNLSFNGVIVGDGSFDGNSFGSGDFFIINNFSFEWDSFNSFDLIVFNVFFLERNVFDSGLDWDFLSDDLLNEVLGSSSDSGVSTGGSGECLVDHFVVSWDSCVRILYNCLSSGVSGRSSGISVDMRV